jgi:phage shock protein A
MDGEPPKQREAMQMAAKPNPFVRGWKYMGAWFGAKIDEKADPKIQIEQAIQEAQRQHQALTTQAAAVIGNQRQLEMQLDRQLNTVENLQSQARQALLLADKARAEGDDTKAAQFEQTAGALANQLVSAESSVEDLKTLHDQALQAAGQAREAVQTNAAMLQQRLAERTKLLSQLEQAKMQESVATSLQQMSDLAAPSNVPSLEEVRDKIERRYAVALGQAELAKDSTGSRVLDVQRATMDMKGAARLDEIRASLAAESTPAVTSGGGTAAIENAAEADAPSVDTTKKAKKAQPS